MTPLSFEWFFLMFGKFAPDIGRSQYGQSRTQGTASEDHSEEVAGT